MNTPLRALAILVTLMALALPAGAIAATVQVTVNDIAITDVQIQQRVALYRLEGKSQSSKAAREELIDEAIKLSEAKRLGITISEAQLDTALQTVARNLKVSRDKLMQLMSDAGVNPDTLKDRLRATLAWNAISDNVLQQQVQMSDADLDQQAAAKATGALGFDYVLKEVLFIGGSRSGQANQYRASFAGCDTAVQLSLKYTDAAVIDVGRRHATQLPEAIAKELAGLNIGGITKPRQTAQGLSMLAVCQKEQAMDTTFVKSDLMNEQGTAELNKVAEKYLADLRAKARIYNN